MSVKDLVDRGLVLRGEIAERQKELEGIETSLKNKAIANSTEHIDLKDADREGKQWIAQGTDKTIPVIFTADKIVGSFKKGGATHESINAALGKKHSSMLTDFYKPTNTFENVFKDGHKFRKAAGEILGDGAPAFITACLARDKFGIAKSDIKIEWDAAKPVAKEGK